jgi:hypothetical protein
MNPDPSRQERPPEYPDRVDGLAYGPLPADREQPEGSRPTAGLQERIADLLHAQYGVGADVYGVAGRVLDLLSREQPAGLREAAQRVLDAQSWEAIIFAKAELRTALLDAAALPEGRE